MPTLGFLGLVNLACVVAVIMWKKWGFWTFCITSVVAFGLNLMIGLGLGSALFGFVGIAVLYAALQTGGDKKGWPQLD